MPDDVLTLAREGMDVHSPGDPEYKVCAALLEQAALNGRLRAALRKYGGHLIDECTGIDGCTCGLDALLAQEQRNDN